jgi:hypothetical protein
MQALVVWAVKAMCLNRVTGGEIQLNVPVRAGAGGRCDVVHVLG